MVVYGHDVVENDEAVDVMVDWNVCMCVCTVYVLCLGLVESNQGV